MFDKIQNLLTNKRARQIVDVRNVVLYIFGILVLAIAWSSARTVQNNYQLQRKISELEQQNRVISLLNGNTYLQNQFYETDEYLELSARQNLGLAAPGEKVLNIPKSIAMKYVDPALADTRDSGTGVVKDNRPAYVKNVQAWRDFLFGRKVSKD